MSTDLDVAKLKMESFSPKSKKTSMSSSLFPNAIDVILVSPDVGFVMLAENWGFEVEYIRRFSAEPTSIRHDDGDQRNQEATSSGGRVTTRVISRERVSRMLSFEGKRVAMNAPSGLGRDWEDARSHAAISIYSMR